MELIRVPTTKCGIKETRYGKQRLQHHRGERSPQDDGEEHPGQQMGFGLMDQLVLMGADQKAGGGFS